MRRSIKALRFLAVPHAAPCGKLSPVRRQNQGRRMSANTSSFPMCVAPLLLRHASHVSASLRRAVENRLESFQPCCPP